MEFLGDNFLLDTSFAQNLYHEYAQSQPIFDYHSHLSPHEILDDKKYADISEIWLAGDHYKWRAMRSCGVAEDYITGEASNREKFQKWAEILPRLQGNPLYQWSHLELKRFFAINTRLNANSAEKIWQECQQKLASDDFSARKLIQRSQVWALCTTDDPCDGLAAHQHLQQHFEVGVFPTFRPDRFINIDRPDFQQALDELRQASGIEVGDYSQLLQALEQRLDHFHQSGCRLADHGLDNLQFAPSSAAEADRVLGAALSRQPLNAYQIRAYKSHLLRFLGGQYHERGWVMQLHLYALRNVNSLFHKQIGADSGFDAIANNSHVNDLASLLDALAANSSLPRTILYSLNPGDTPLLGALIGCFQQQDCPGYLQLGSAWWFNDTLSGMKLQLQTLAESGNIGGFIGMLTDSRSFLSYTRHEYFRRILCRLFGSWVAQGIAPRDLELFGGLVKDICFNNVRNYIPVEWPQ